MRFVFAAAGFLCATPAFAQQVSLAEMQSARNQFMGLFASCDSGALAMQAQIAKQAAEIAELRAAAEKRPEAPAAK